MIIYYPSLIASAIFFSAIVVNIHENKFANVLFISLFAIPTILFLGFISNKNLDMIAYTLILAPIILVYVGYHMGLPTPVKANAPVPHIAHVVPDRMEKTEGASCRSCNQIPCVCPVALPSKSV